MKQSLLVIACIFMGGAAVAGPVGSACMRAGRTADGALCGCIQQVADTTLTNADQRRAAVFFSDPEMAQQVRMSDRPSDEDFWNRYTRFAQSAESLCAR